jgi:hypothetical protein
VRAAGKVGKLRHRLGLVQPSHSRSTFVAPAPARTKPYQICVRLRLWPQVDWFLLIEATVYFSELAAQKG